MYTYVCIYGGFGGLVTKPCPTHTTPWTVVHQAPLSMGILQAKILKWVAISFSRCVYIYVCVYVYMPVYTPKCIYTYVCIYMYVCIYLCVYPCVYMCVYIPMCVYTCVYLFIYLEWVAFPFSRGTSPPRDHIQIPQGKPKNTGVGSLSLLQWIFLTQELNQGLLNCRQILYWLSYQGNPCVFIHKPMTCTLLFFPQRQHNMTVTVWN